MIAGSKTRSFARLHHALVCNIYVMPENVISKMVIIYFDIFRHFNILQVTKQFTISKVENTFSRITK